MSEPLLTRSSPFVRRHAEAVGIAPRDLRAQVATVDLYGARALRYPVMALLVSREMGPCRHALEQRVVAGTVLMHAPVPVVRK